MALALRVLVQRQLRFRLGSRRHLLLARPVKRLAMPPPPLELSIQRANSLALEPARPQAREKNPKAQVKLRTALVPVNLPAPAKRRG